MEKKILLTGDYWHRDFQNVLKGFDAVTLVSIDKIATLADESFDLAIVAQSRPGQFPEEKIEFLQSRLGNTPLVAILGSWCEGELRTGTPWPGVIRVYWHQWEGRFRKFVEQLDSQGITDWHAERTFTPADRILRPSKARSRTKIEVVGVSSWTQTQFEMLRDAIQSFGWDSKWIERCTWDAHATQFCNPICVTADSFSAELENRVRWLHSEFPHARFVMVLGFPRTQDVENCSRLGISQVVSKPFELDDLRVAIENAFASKSSIRVASED